MIRPGGTGRRSGARCWLDQELVRPDGRDSSQSCRCGFPALRPALSDPTSEAGGSVEMLADEVDYVVGVDTHRDQHVLAVVVARTGVVVARRSVRSSARGYAEALRFAQVDADGVRVWAVEGAGHYGAGLARHLSGRGETVLEIGRGLRDEQRLHGKDDQLDAIRAARTALASRTLTLPRAGERREALRLLLLARRSAVDVRRDALVQLRSVIVTCPDQLREELRVLPAGRLEPARFSVYRWGV